MYTHNSENSTLSAPIHNSRCTSGTKINSGYDSSTNLIDTVAGTDSSAQQCELEQPDPGHSDVLHTTKTKHVQSAGKKFQCRLCLTKFTRADNLRSHLLTHSDEWPLSVLYLQQLTDENHTLSIDMPEASEDSDKSLVKIIPSGDEPDCEGFSGGIGFSDHQIDLQRSSDSEGRSNHKVRHVSKETTFAHESGGEIDGNGRHSDNAKGSLSPDETSSDSGSENGYNDTKEGSVLNCSQRALISRLMDEICSSFFYQVSHRPRQRGQGGQGSRESSSSSTGQTTITNSFIGEYRGTRRKRGHKEDEGAEDEDDGKHKRPRDQNCNDGHSTRVRYFACPFHKFDASTYGSGNADPRVGLKYRSCGPPGWPNIGKLK